MSDEVCRHQPHTNNRKWFPFVCVVVLRKLNSWGALYYLVETLSPNGARTWGGCVVRFTWNAARVCKSLQRLSLFLPTQAGSHNCGWRWKSFNNRLNAPGSTRHQNPVTPHSCARLDDITSQQRCRASKIRVQKKQKTKNRLTKVSINPSIRAKLGRHVRAQTDGARRRQPEPLATDLSGPITDRVSAQSRHP